MRSNSLILCSMQILAFAMAAAAVAADGPSPESRRLNSVRGLEIDRENGFEFASAGTPGRAEGLRTRDRSDDPAGRMPETTITLTRLMNMVAEPVAGIWKLDRNKTNGPAASAINVDWIQVEVTDGILVLNWHSRGRAVHGKFAARYDGEDYPVKGDPDVDTVSLKRIDDGTIDFIYKKNGKIAISERSLVAKDGSTSTIRTTYKDAAGQDITVVTVWEKQ